MYDFHLFAEKKIRIEIDATERVYVCVCALV